MSNPCLVIIFNHRYDDNINRLEAFYRKKFSNIFFLVPFYTGSKENVIAVYESSHYFQGYIAQGFKRFYRPEFTHYFFIGDDLIINPKITGHNYQNALGLGVDTSYMPEVLTFDTNHHWLRKPLAITYFSNRQGSEGNKEMPSYAEAITSFANHGIKIEGLNYTNIFGQISIKQACTSPFRIIKNLIKYHWRWRAFKKNGKLKLPYPLVYGYSDIVIVSASAIQRFCHLCGVLSAQGLFVEIAIPTALFLSAARVITDADIGLVGAAMWDNDDIQKISTRFQFSFDKLEKEFPEEIFYYHPIKLSKWK